MSGFGHSHGPGHSHDHSHAHAGGHNHAPDSAADRAAQSRVLWATLVLNAGFLIVEVVGGVLFNSLTLLADAVHMTTDVVSIVVALVAARMLRAGQTDRHTYGLRRAEVIGAQLNALLLLGAAVWIFIEATDRLAHPEPVVAGGMLAVAVAGLAVNVASAAIAARFRNANVNMSGVFWHMAVDAVGSVAAIISAAAALMFGVEWADPLTSILVGLLAAWSGARLLRTTTHILLEGTPEGVDVAAVRTALADADGIAAVHHVHVWSLASDEPALSAHVVLAHPGTLHDANDARDTLKDLLAHDFGITHVTLEMECHPCAEIDGGGTHTH